MSPDTSKLPIAPRPEHALKCWPEHFNEIWHGHKTCEVRRDDRGFAVGDFLRLREYAPDLALYTRREICAVVTHVLAGGQFGIAEGYCVLSIRVLGSIEGYLPGLDAP